MDDEKVPWEVVRIWTVRASDMSEALEKARPGEHQEVVAHRMPCSDWPAPCSHDPLHYRPD